MTDAATERGRWRRPADGVLQILNFKTQVV
jgi:hypothetical protein